MLTPFEKKQLKSIANTISTRYQVGKNEITDTLLDMLGKALVSHELIKIDVMKAAETPIMEIALDLSSKLNADVVDIIGRVIILYRKNQEKPKIKLLKKWI